QALVAELAGDAELPPGALAQIAEVAEGNPLFLEQMLAMVREDGLAPGEVSIPPTIHALLGARLDRLPPDERDVLERAAVIGKEFWRGSLVDLLPEEGRDGVDASLQKLVGRELIRPVRSLFAGDEAFRFRHILLREAA